MKALAFKAKLAKAQKRLEALIDYESWVKASGSNYGAAKHVCEKYNISDASLYLYRQMVRGLNESDWLWALFPGWARQGGVKADIPVAAWDIFIASYFGPDGQDATRCYKLLKRLAPARGWSIPSYKTCLRRLYDEFPQPRSGRY